MKTTRIDIKILLDLFKSVDGLIPYIFYQRYKYSPATVFNTLSKFNNYIENVNDKYVLTKAGREYIEKNRFVFGNDKFERIPEEFKVKRIEINEPYLPDITKLSKEILILQHKGDGQETCT